jgi:3-oxoacyl-[acyl-carrier protein] reductase
MKSIFFLIKEAIPLLLNAPKDPNILVISSAGGKKPTQRSGVYAMTKASLNNMTEWLALELVDRNIRVNGIGPGVIPTKLSGPIVANIKKAGNPFPGILGKPEDIGGLAAAICSKDGAFLNGETIYPHGGFLGLGKL